MEQAWPDSFLQPSSTLLKPSQPKLPNPVARLSPHLTRVEQLQSNTQLILGACRLPGFFLTDVVPVLRVLTVPRDTGSK